MENKIKEIAEGMLADEGHFLVDVSVSSSGSNPKVRILLDGDEVVSIDDCARLSRQMGESLEAVFEGAFTLEVSSPGVDFPLTIERQYRKNIGRTLKVSLEGGKEIKGELLSVDTESITIGYQKGKGKDKEEVIDKIPYEEIKKAIVQISFK